MRRRHGVPGAGGGAGSMTMKADRNTAVQIVDGLRGQRLQQTAKVIGEVADQAAGKRQRVVIRQISLTQAGDTGAQALKESRAAFVRGRRQSFQRPRADDVEAAPIGIRPAAVQQHGARFVANDREVAGRIKVVGERVYETGWHSR